MLCNLKSGFDQGHHEPRDTDDSLPTLGHIRGL